MNLYNKTIQELIDLNLIEYKQIDDIINKSIRTEMRLVKRARAVVIKGVVLEKASELLVEAGAVVKHRTVWNAVGRTDYTRDEVLCALRTLRDDGVLQNIRTSGNNFQVFWALAVQPEVPGFSSIEDITPPE